MRDLRTVASGKIDSLCASLMAKEVEERPKSAAAVAAQLRKIAAHERFVAATLAGMAYALVLYRRGRVSDCILAHATTNALIAASVVLLGDWRLWT